MIKMKKVFIGLSGGAGPMIRCIPIAIELQKRGYEIYYYSRDYSSHYMDFIKFQLHIQRDMMEALVLQVNGLILSILQQPMRMNMSISNRSIHVGSDF